LEAIQVSVPGFGADAAELLRTGGTTGLPDVIASIANDAAKLPAGSTIVVDDFHHAEPSVSRDMTDLVEFWAAETAQLILSARADPSLRLHRLRVSGDLCELRDRDLRFSLEETRDLLANFDVAVGDADLEMLHERSEGWTAAVQMAALTLRETEDTTHAVRAIGARGHALAEYFVSEVLDQQPPEVVDFMLDTSVLDVLTPEACTAITGKPEAEALLHRIEAANLFVQSLDEERTSFRSHHLTRQLLRAELRARDRQRSQALQLRAAEWLESTGDLREAARGFLEADQPDRALAVIKDRVITDYLNDAAPRTPLNLPMFEPSVLLESSDRLLLIALDLLLSGDEVRGREYLDLIEQAEPAALSDARQAARFATARALRFLLNGQANEAAIAAQAARDITMQAQLADVCDGLITAILLRAYVWLGDLAAVEREAANALADLGLPDPIKLVFVPGAQALAWYESGQLARASDAAESAERAAEDLGFSQHVFASDCLRTLAGLALERRDLVTAEKLIDRVLAISSKRSPVAFLALLDRAMIWSARGQVREALATLRSARSILDGTASPLLARADELEGLLRLSLGDLRSPVDLAAHLAPAPRSLLLAKVALANNDHDAAQQQLRAHSLDKLGARYAVVRQLLLATAAIQRSDPLSTGVLGTALQCACESGFLNTVVTTAPLLATYLIEHSGQLRQVGFMEQLISAAVEVRSTLPSASRSGRLPTGHLTPAELRVLKLLPTSNCPQIAATLFVSNSTVKTHLRSIYQKLGAATRSAAIERAVDLRLL
jgi:LuxR family maltose regulon positive regulatory protein